MEKFLTKYNNINVYTYDRDDDMYRHPEYYVDDPANQYDDFYGNFIVQFVRTNDRGAIYVDPYNAYICTNRLNKKPLDELLKDLDDVKSFRIG